MAAAVELEGREAMVVPSSLLPLVTKPPYSKPLPPQPSKLSSPPSMEGATVLLAVAEKERTKRKKTSVELQNHHHRPEKPSLLVELTTTVAGECAEQRSPATTRPWSPLRTAPPCLRLLGTAPYHPNPFLLLSLGSGRCRRCMWFLSCCHKLRPLRCPYLGSGSSLRSSQPRLWLCYFACWGCC
ncbi:hypothetical protein PIB30_063758 [Stylosanthes scabra]|uniref:Uncharacterized protein n=1 Tax=Stylosanthes scabra TaxID=79078 RepID=A0ABU6TLB2_9FABA|nr:hypothetical protein [Stylosanthes scabra]